MRARVPVRVCVGGGGGARALVSDSMSVCVFTQILLYSTRANRLPDD